MKRWPLLFTGIALWVLVFAQEAPGEKVRLSADTMRYEPGAKMFSVEGHVRIRRGEGTIFAQKGTGKSDGSYFALEGKVECELPEQKLHFSCDKVSYYPKDNPRMEALGNVEARQGVNAIQAAEVLWYLQGIPHYSASGDVRVSWGERRFEAGLVTRKDHRFWAKKMDNFEDTQEGIRIQAPLLEGTLLEGEVVEVVLSGGVVMETLESKEAPVKVTGKKCIYSVEKGTLVISGGAFAQQGERTMKAENLVFRLDTRTIEAKGKPQLVFTVGD